MRFAATTKSVRNRAVLPILGTALIPAVLVLALACMSMSRAEEAARLPTPLARPPAARESPIVSVWLSRTGAVTIAGQKVAADVAAAWQRERAALAIIGFKPHQATLELRADSEVPAEAIQQFIEQADKAGFQRCVLRDAKEDGNEVHR